MKNIPPNVWRASLNEDDWNFLQIQNDEWPECLVWELRREKTQAEAGGNFPTDPVYEPTVQGRGRFGVRFAGQKRAGICSKPDWSSYLSRRKRGTGSGFKSPSEMHRLGFHWIGTRFTGTGGMKLNMLAHICLSHQSWMVMRKRKSFHSEFLGAGVTMKSNRPSVNG